MVTRVARGGLAAFLLVALLGPSFGQSAPPSLPPERASPPPGAVDASTVLPSDAAWTATPSGRASLFELIAKRVEESYWNPAHLDWDAWRDRHRSGVVEAGTPGTLDRAFRRMFEDVGDDHTRWIGREGIPPTGGGPGAPDEVVASPVPRLGATVRPLDGRGLLLMRVHPGGAADAAGLRRGDVIVAVDEAPLTEPGIGWGMRTILASALRRGAATVAVHRTRDRVTATVEPRALPEGAAQRPLVERAEDFAAARLEIPTFSAGTAERVHAELESLQAAGVSYLVLDLRGNPGGSVAEMGLVLGAFLEGEPLTAYGREGVDWRLRIDRSDEGLDVRLVRRDPRTGRDAARTRLSPYTRWDGPVAVLVDEGTASAAEAFAGTLAHEVGAAVVGSRTPGNVETIRRIAFPGGHAAMVAVGDLRRADGGRVAPVAPTAEARLDPVELARGLDAPFAVAIQVLRGLSWTPGAWF